VKHIKNIYFKAILFSLADIAIIWSGIVFYRFLPYYQAFLKPATQQILLLLGVIYLFTSFPVQLYRIQNGQDSKATLLIEGLKHLIIYITYRIRRLFPKQLTEVTPISQKEKTVILFYLVKFFYIPLMIDFACWNAIYLKNFIPYIPSPLNTYDVMLYFNNYIYPVVFSGVFFLNSAIYAFGYMFEAEFLKNKVRSVDSTMFGWVVCIICYPPFSFWYAQVFPSYANEMTFFINTGITFIVRLIICLILFYMLYSVIVLGTKCSNLVNRGIVTTGPYKLIRHPHYITKNVVWWITGMPVFIHKPIGIFFWRYGVLLIICVQ